MKIGLTQVQRIFTAAIYFAVLIVIFQALGGDVYQLAFNNGVDSSIWFYAGALMIILGQYVVEPFFTKPSDVIANSTAAIIALVGLSKKGDLFAYEIIFWLAVSVLILALISILIKDSKLGRAKKIAYWISTRLGSAKFIFSLIYLSAAYSYYAHQDDVIAFISIIAFWIVITFFDVVGKLIKTISSLGKFLSGNSDQVIGKAIGHDNPMLFKAEMDYEVHKKADTKYGDIVLVETEVNSGSVGMVVNTKQLLGKKWLTIYLLQDSDNNVIKISLKSRKLITDKESIFSSDHSIYEAIIENLDPEVKKLVESNPLYKNRKGFIGCVANGSNIETINFLILRDLEECKFQLSEGSILKVNIYGQETLYQVINGNTKEEHLENFDTYGYTVGVARKLGKYDKPKNDLKTVKWMPTIYSPVSLAFEGTVSSQKIKSIAQRSIGRLPGTDLEIPIKSINDLVTHNTAILGVLGIGKSRLSNELMKRTFDKGIFIIVIDITNEYTGSLSEYIDPASIISDDENSFNELNSSFDYIHEVDGTKDYLKSGNEQKYEEAIFKDLSQYFFNTDVPPQGASAFTNDPKVKIYNPDYHKVSKGEKVGYGVITAELTQSEKVRIIATQLFKILMGLGISEDKKARVLLVLEEAHSLIPEWGSVSSDGDKTATNGTAKVILQGRKYGLGTLVITQRTANVSKSILNQCNTIFALRVFDDTGKGFLENYIGGDYAATLPTLEERHAIVTGKGLKLQQPVIIQLNEMNDVVRQAEEPSVE